VLLLAAAFSRIFSNASPPGIEVQAVLRASKAVQRSPMILDVGEVDMEEILVAKKGG